MKASYGVFRIVKFAEQAFRVRVRGTGALKITTEPDLIRKLTNDVIASNGRKIESFFPTVPDQRFDNEPVFEDDHITQITKKVCQKYFLFLYCKPIAKSLRDK